MYHAIESTILVLLQRLHHGGGHTNFGIISINVDSHLESPYDYDEDQENNTATAPAAAGDLSFAFESQGSRILEGVEPVEEGLFGETMLMIVI